MNRNQIAPIVIVVCGTLLIMCAACSVLASDYFSRYFLWLDTWLKTFAP